MASKQSSGDPACLRGTFDTLKHLDEDTTPTDGALPLECSEGTPRVSGTNALANGTSKSPPSNTRYSLANCAPETFGSTTSDGGSLVELPSAFERLEDRETENSNDLEFVISTSLTRNPNVDSHNNNSGRFEGSLPDFSAFFRLSEFTLHKSDRSVETLYRIVSKFSSENGNQDLQIGNVHSLYSHDPLFRSLIMANHGKVPNTAGAQSLFTPVYSDDVLRSAESSDSPKDWELGFKTGIFQCTLRTSDNKKPIVARYNMSGEQGVFDHFQTDAFAEVIEMAAWLAISAKINPNITQQAASPGFENLAADFFNGREVRENYRSVPTFNASVTTNYRITYNNQNAISEAIWEEIHNNAAFSRFILDISLCNDIESHRSRGLKWNGAKVVKSGQGDLKTLVEILKDLTKTPKPSKSVDRKTDESTVLSGQNVYVLFIEDSETPNVTESPPALKSDENATAEGNLENGDDWMILDRKKEMEKTSKKSSKKAIKVWSRRAKKTIQIEPTFDAENDDDASSLPTYENLEDTDVQEPFMTEEEKGDWSVVPKKAPFHPGRSVGGSSNNARNGSMRCQNGYHIGQVDRISNIVCDTSSELVSTYPDQRQNRSTQEPPTNPSRQALRQDNSNTTTSGNAATQRHRTMSNVGQFQSRQGTVLQCSPESAPNPKPALKTPQVTRLFVAEEFPALKDSIFPRSSLSAPNATDQTRNITTPINNSSAAQIAPPTTKAIEWSTFTSPERLLSTPNKSKYTTASSTNEVLEVDAPPYVSALPDKFALAFAVDTSPRPNDERLSDATVQGQPQEVSSSGEEPDSSLCEVLFSQPSKLDEVELSQDDDYSETSSTTIQEDAKDIYDNASEQDASILILSATDQPSPKSMNVERIASTPMAPAEERLLLDAMCHKRTFMTAIVVDDHELPATKDGDENANSETGHDESHGSDNELSSVEIFTSPSQFKNSPIVRARGDFKPHDVEATASEASPSTFRAHSQSYSSVQQNGGQSEIDISPGYGEQDDFNISDPESNPNFNEAASHTYEEETSNVPAPSTQILGLKNCSESFTLVTESEASRLISTKKIKIRTARHSSGGVSIPNFYSISSSDEESEPEVASSNIKCFKVISVKEPTIRCGTHSAKTRAATRNFFYNSSDDEDFDVATGAMGEISVDAMNGIISALETTTSSYECNAMEQLPAAAYAELHIHGMSVCGGIQSNFHSPDDQIQEPSYAGHIEISPSLVSKPATKLPYLDHEHKPEFSTMDDAVSDEQASIPIQSYQQSNPFIHSKYIEQLPLGFGINEFGSDESTGIPIFNRNFSNESIDSASRKQELLESGIYGTTSGSQTECKLHRDTEAHEHPSSIHADFVRSSYSFNPHAFQPDENSSRRRSSASHLPFISPGQDLNHGSFLHGQRPSSLYRNADTRYDLNIGSSQQSSGSGSPYTKLEGQHSGLTTLDSQTLGNSRMLRQGSNGKVVTQAQNTSQYAANCTYCGERNTPSAQAPQVLCSGCGPTSNVRYCSVACLLVDSMAHTSVCMNYTAHRPAFYELPGFFIYIQNPITSEAGYVESPERYRQRVFSMHCSSGPFPKLFMAWMKKSTVLLSGTFNSDPNETIKRTGDYVIFRSGSTQVPPRNNPNADVIYTIKFHRDDVKKQVLARTLNACFLTWNDQIIEFLYRLLRHYILDPEYFSMFKYTEPLEVVWSEFQHQFKQEFHFDASMQKGADQLFNSVAEWRWASDMIGRLESHYPILTQWISHLI